MVQRIFFFLFRKVPKGDHGLMVGGDRPEPKLLLNNVQVSI